MTLALPPLALSVRQPWAWAIIAGHKKIENRSLGAIRAGNMGLGRISIHAATGLKRDEFEWGEWRLHRHGVICPRPDELPRGAIIGSVDVVEIADDFDSEWFGGDWGLRLENPSPCEPIPCAGALGYFAWAEGGAMADPAPWMITYNRPAGDSATPLLFDDLPPAPRTTPKRPARKGR